MLQLATLDNIIQQKLNNWNIIVKALIGNFMSMTYNFKQLFYIFMIGMSVESSNKYSNKERAMCRWSGSSECCNSK